MNSPSQIFDTNLLSQRRARFKEEDKVDFLQKFCIKNTIERLNDLNREYKSVGILTDFYNLWRENFDFKNIEKIENREIFNIKPNHFDLIISTFCIHWSNDPIGHIIQLKNGLKKDGLLLIFLLGGQTLKELKLIFNVLDKKRKINFSSKIAPMADIKDYGKLLLRAGLALPVADNFILNVEYTNLLNFFKDLRKMGETNICFERNKKNINKKDLLEIERLYYSNFSCSSKKKIIKTTFEIICLTGWFPSDNQQKPLKPGTAMKSLTDVLIFKE